MRYYMSVILVLFTLNTVAADLVRPGPHNKIGHTKQDNKEDTFFYKLFNDELDPVSYTHLTLPTICSV